MNIVQSITEPVHRKKYILQFVFSSGDFVYIIMQRYMRADFTQYVNLLIKHEYI